MPLGYCTRASCAEAGQREDKLRAALASLVADLEDPEPDGPEAKGRDGDESVDLAPMFAAKPIGGTQRCRVCGATINNATQPFCTSCGHLPKSHGHRPSALRLNLQRSVTGFPGQTLALPKGRFRISLNHNGHAIVIRMGQRALVELESAPGETLAVTEKEGFGLHTLAPERVTLTDGQSLRIGQQLLVVNRSPLGTYPSAGKGSRDDGDTRLAAPALRRAPWYLHRLLPNGSVGDLIPMVGDPTVGDEGCDIDLKDALATGKVGHFEVSDELQFVVSGSIPVWVKAKAGQVLSPGEDLWLGDAIYRLERSHD